jgi:hypothetical protein
MFRRQNVSVALLVVLLAATWVQSSGLGVEACRSWHATYSREALISSLSDLVSSQALYNTIRDLQDDDANPGWDAARTRYTLSPELAVERDYVRGRMQALGLVVQEHPFTFKGTTQINLEGTLPGQDGSEDTVYILCAHYDSFSYLPRVHAPGADDNASGVAGLLEAARILSQYRFRHTLRFVAFAAEEQDMVGSSFYAQAARAADTQIGGVINLDMIAWNGTHSDALEIYADTQSASQALSQALIQTLATYNIALKPRYNVTKIPAYSDHYSFWRQDYPAILVTDDTSEPNPFYHTFDDTLEQLDMVYTRKFVQAVVATLAEQAEIVLPEAEYVTYLPVYIYDPSGTY